MHTVIPHPVNIQFPNTILSKIMMCFTNLVLLSVTCTVPHSNQSLQFRPWMALVTSISTKWVDDTSGPLDLFSAATEWL